jgi:uncharacterized protein YdeI (YjbR/CyaY-like superfamily)
MNPVFFNNKPALRAWFEKHHTTETELLVGYFKTNTKKESITWSQSVDEALCFGWIDGIRRSINEESYSIRFTPRRPGSKWSEINIKKVEELTKQGLMVPAGLKAFSKRKVTGSSLYSYESNKKVTLEEPMEVLFRQNLRAWNYFQSETPSYRKITIRWVMDAKQEITRMNRLNELITSSEAGEKIRAMRWSLKK